MKEVRNTLFRKGERESAVFLEVHRFRHLHLSSGNNLIMKACSAVRSGGLKKKMAAVLGHWLLLNCVVLEDNLMVFLEEGE